MQSLMLGFIAVSIKAPCERPRTVARDVSLFVIPARSELDSSLQRPQKTAASPFSAHQRRPTTAKNKPEPHLGQALGA
jgi:hypothetical protein